MRYNLRGITYAVLISLRTVAIHMTCSASRILLLLLCIFSISSRSWAASTLCSACYSIDNLTKEFKAIDYSNDVEMANGGGKIDSVAVPLLQEFGEISKTAPDRIKLFKSLLALVLAATPYDFEAELAHVLAKQIKGDSTLRSAYADYIKALPDSPQSDGYCTAQLMRTTVDEIVCDLNAGITGQDVANEQQAAKAQKCVKPFNYGECLSAATKQ